MNINKMLEAGVSRKEIYLVYLATAEAKDNGNDLPEAFTPSEICLHKLCMKKHEHLQAILKLKLMMQEEAAKKAEKKTAVQKKATTGTAE